MQAIILKTKDKSNLKLVADLARKLGMKVSEVTEDTLDDIALGTLMKKEKTGRNASRAAIMKKLSGA